MHRLGIRATWRETCEWLSHPLGTPSSTYSGGMVARGICRGLVRTPFLKKLSGTSPLATTLSLLLDGHPLPTWPVWNCRVLCCLPCPQVSMESVFLGRDAGQAVLVSCSGSQKWGK